MLSKLSFKDELETVDRQVNKELRFKSISFKELVPLELSDLDRFGCPALVLAASKASGGIIPNSLTIAQIIQFIFLGYEIHNLITDDEDLPEQRRQFPVLVGDFLYGKFFLGLANANLLHYLEPITHVVQSMSEGMVLRWQNENSHSKHDLKPEDWWKVFEKQRGFLTGLSAKLGADLNGASAEFQDFCERFGRLLGIAWAASTTSVGREMVEDTLNRAKELIDNQRSLYDLKPLYEVYDYITFYLGRSNEQAKNLLGND